MLPRRLTCFILTALLSMATGASAFASDDAPPVDESKFVPKMKLSSPSTIEVREGQLNEVYIEVKNVGTGRASNFFMQVVPEPEQPFTVTYELQGGSDIAQIGVTKRLKLLINVDRGAEEKVYPLKLSYSYTNDYRASFAESDTLNIKVVNPLAAKIRLYDFELVPSALKAGETGELFFNYMNIGSADERNVRFSLEGLDPTKITVPDGLNSQDFALVRTHTVESTSFKIKASPNCPSGSYPIQIVTTTRSSSGEPTTSELTYYISVGGGTDTGTATLDIVNPAPPSGVYGVGESIGLSFEIFNSSKFDAENVLVKAEAVEGNAIVPTSQSMFLTRVLKAGETKKHSFTFAATSAAKTQNYPLSFTIEYDSGSSTGEDTSGKISFSQYFGVNVSNPEEEKGEEEKEIKNIPKIIVSSYSCEPTIVRAGEEFDLMMTFMNSHSSKLVRNIKVSLTVTDKDEKIGASIFSPVNASNTLFIDQIEPKATENRVIRYFAVPNASAQTYSINVNFDYEDADGNKIEEKEIIGVNVSQPPIIETSDIMLDEYAELGMPLFLSFQIYNKGKAAVNNVMVELEGDIQASNGKSIWIGNMESGASEYLDESFNFNSPGQQEVRVIVSYDSVTGEHFEIPHEFSIMVNEPMPFDPDDFPQEMPDEPGFGGFFSTHKVPVLIGGGIALAAIGAVGFVLFKRYKKKQKDFDFDE